MPIAQTSEELESQLEQKTTLSPEGEEELGLGVEAPKTELEEPIYEKDIVGKSGFYITHKVVGEVDDDNGSGTVSRFVEEKNGSYGVIFTADLPCEVISVTETHSAASSSGTLDIENLSSGTAAGAGNSILSATFDLTTTADTPIKKIGNSGELTGYAKLSTGDRLALVPGGTLTNLRDLHLTLYLRYTENGEYRVNV